MHAPPPGFATRNTRVAPAANAVPTPPSLAAISSPGLKPLTASRPTSSPALEAMVVAGSPSVPPRSASSAELDRLFDEDPKLTPSPAPATDEPLPPMFELGAPWPSLVPAHWAKAAVLALLKGEKQPLPSWNLPVPPPPPPAFDAAPPASGGAAPEPAAMAAPPEPPLPRLEPPDEVAAVARRVVDSVPATERAAIDKPGGEPFVELVATRIALGAAEAEGKRLLAAQQAVLVDGGAHDALTQLADAVAARVQGEADKAMKQGELEALQLVAGARGALSRDLIALRYVADQLRGLGQHPGLGAGALDPEVHLAAAAPKPAAKPTEASTARASEFGDYREKPRRSRSFALAGAGVLLALGAIYGYSRLSSFARVGLSSGDLEAAGDDVVRIEVSGKIAMVTVKPAFLEQPVPAVAKVVEVLRPKGIERAMVELENGLPLGQIDVSTGRPIYLAPAPGKHPPK